MVRVRFFIVSLFVVGFFLLPGVLSFDVFVSGRDGVEGFVRGDDVVRVLVRGDGLVRDDVRVGVGGVSVFVQECRSEGGLVVCVYEEPVGGRRGVLSFDVFVGGVFKNVDVVVDGSAPQVVMKAIPDVTRGGVQVEFVVEDVSGVVGSCSGLRNVKVLAGDTVIGVGVVDECMSEGVVSALLVDSVREVCVVAEDVLGQVGRVCSGVVVDSVPPEVVRVGLFDGLKEVRAVKDGLVVGVGVMFDDVFGMDSSSVMLDVSSLSGKVGDVRRAVKSDGVFVVDDVVISSLSYCRVGVVAADVVGNVVSGMHECSMVRDSAGSVPLVLRTNLLSPDGGFVVSKENGVVVAEIQDVSLAKGNVFLDASSLSGEGRVRADECRDISFGVWECSWKNLKVTKSGPYRVELLGSSFDDVGNVFQNGLKLDVEVSDVVVGVQDVTHAPRVLVDGGELLLSFFVVSQSVPAVFVNVSGVVGGGSGLREAECVAAGVRWQCSLAVDDLRVGKGVLEILLDGLVERYSLEVFPVLGVSEVSVVGVGLHPPSGVDRKVADRVPYPVVVQPFLRVDARVDVVSVSAVCDEEFLFEPVRVLSESKNPLLLFKFSPGVVLQEEVRVGCVLRVTTGQGGVVHRPVLVNVSVRVPVYNSPLGSVDDAVLLKLAGLDDRISDLETEAKKWGVVNQVLGRIGGVAETVVQVDAVLSVLNFVTWLIPFVSSFHQVVCQVHNNLHYGVVLDMWPPGVVPSIGEPVPFSGYAASAKLPLVKVAALINSCYLCDFSGKYKAGGRYLGALQVDLMQGLLYAGAEKGKGLVSKEGSSVVFNVESDVFDPQKSMHVAAACLCPQGIEYNLKKERQVACRLRGCLKEHAQRGLPIVACERENAVENCLYVDGAVWKVAGGPALSAVLSRLLSGVNDNLPSSVMGAVWQRSCPRNTGELKQSTNAPCQKNVDPRGAARVALCGVLSVPSLLFETKFFEGNRFDWNQYDAKLRGVDFCD